LAQRGRKLAPERRELLGRLIEDEWPIRQIVGTHGFNFYTVKRLYPEYTGMTAQESGQLSMAVQRTNETMKKIYGVRTR